MRIIVIIAILLVGYSNTWAYFPDHVIQQLKINTKPGATTRTGDCAQATKQIDQDINNVRARLSNGGDVWWDFSRGRYIVPKVDAASGKPEVSSIFAGSVWMGGYDPAGALKFAGNTFRSRSSNDYFSGPLTDAEGTTTEKDCKDWDLFFQVLGTEVDQHKRKYKEVEGIRDLTKDEIPENILFWPARGNNVNFSIKYKFELPNLKQGLASFFDRNGDGMYQPEKGDYPVIDIRGCPLEETPDQMFFWIYNDGGNVHTSSGGEPIRMETQVQSFAFASGDEINDMTFQRYKLINRAPQDIRDCYFAMWIDPDLGCHSDDYIGCDTTFEKYEYYTKPSGAVDSFRRNRDMMYIYNIDAVDGSNGCNCDRGVNTYCNDVPILAVDYFRGPTRDTFEIVGGEEVEYSLELGMSSFMYYNNGSVGTHPTATTDPGQGNEEEFYRYITGRWRDGSPLTVGGSGYNPGSTNTTRYAMPGEPGNENGWSMCTATSGEGDRRTIQASGPFVLKPGAVNELIIGAVWVPDQQYPCPNLDELISADKIAQDLFDNCFDRKVGPDAPDMDFVELDQEIVILLSNDPNSNNYRELYKEAGLGIPFNVDSLYRFEGYRVFQLASADVVLNQSTINDLSQVREIATIDIKNKIQKIYNWKSVPNPVPSASRPKIWFPEVMVTGLDGGIRHSLNVIRDQFSDSRLVNHKKYYYVSIAYAYNNFADFDIDNVSTTQRTQYCPGSRNIGPNRDSKPYVVVPRPQIYEKLRSAYGEGFPIERREATGNGGNFVDLTDASREAIFGNTHAEIINYKPGAGPVEVKVINPLELKDGEYELKFIDGNMDNNTFDAPVTYELRNLAEPSKVIASDFDIERFNEQLIADYGISISLGQVKEPGAEPFVDETNGGIGIAYEYDNNNAPWFFGYPDDLAPALNFVKSALGETNYNKDPFRALINMGPTEVQGAWVPFDLTDGEITADPVNYYFTPGFINAQNDVLYQSMDLPDLNNVDVVFTSDKSKWSRCVVLETVNHMFHGQAANTIDGSKNLELRKSKSVGKDADPNDPNIAKEDGDGIGMGWFPGYAVDVLTGKRLNIMFGENSTYRDDDFVATACTRDGKGYGDDMIFNPTDEIQNNDCIQNQNIWGFVAGHHHYIYVTRTTYDSCRVLRSELSLSNIIRRARALKEVTWCSMTTMIPGTSMKSYKDGLIPNELVVKLRVNEPYKWTNGTKENKGYNLYRFKVENKQAVPVASAEDVKTALDDVNVVPNPYYAFSEYETGQFSNTVKITNLPAKCEVTIFSIDGKLIKQYARDEKAINTIDPTAGVKQKQITPDLEWDLANFKQIPISSGAYLIHVKDGNTGEERIIKWFGVMRKFDPTGL